MSMPLRIRRFTNTGRHVYFAPAEISSWPKVTSLSPLFCEHLYFLLRNIKVSGWKWPWGATEKVLSWLVEVSWRVLRLVSFFTSPFLDVPFLPPLVLALSVRPIILDFMRNCLESAVLNQFPFPGPKAPLSLSQTFDDCPRNVFWASQGDGGSQWWSWLRGTELRTVQTHWQFLQGPNADLFFSFSMNVISFGKKKKKIWSSFPLHNGYVSIRSWICKSLLLRLIFPLSDYDWGF